jgi:hypothetical protein
MLRESSQEKSTPWEEVAETSATGICTSPKLIAPFQIARAIAVAPQASNVQVTCGARQKFQSVAAKGFSADQRSGELVLHVPRDYWVNKTEPGA